MKRRFLQLFLFCAALLIALGTQAQSRPFITRWKCESGSTKFRVPIVGTNFKLVLKKADGTPLVTEPSLTVAAIKDAYTCTVPEAGEYLVEVGPEGVSHMQSIRYDSYDTYGNEQKLIEVVSWGDVAWTTMEGAFAYCENFNINPSAGVPNLQNVKSMRSMFNGCRSFNSNIEDWDVSNVENMRFIFRLCDEFNQPLNKWGSKLSKVTNFYGMFYGCGKFNQPLDKWDVSRATDMQNMFAYCTVFDQALNSWDVRSVKTMADMFFECHAFNKPLDAWGDKVQNVEDMNGIFYHARSFDQSLGNWQLRKCKVLSFSQCGMSVENYEKSLQGWAAQPDIAKEVVLVAENLLYTNAAVAAREKLYDENGADWAMYYDLLIPTNLQGNRPFITRWVAEANETLKIGLNGVNLNITWYAVGSNEKHQIKMPRAQSYKPLEITVPAAGEYLVEVAPQGFVAITTPYAFGAREESKKYFTSHKRLLEIVQWGDVKWGTMRDAFRECYHVTLGPRAGIPDLSNVKDCTRMFYHCDEFNQSVNNWDVSGVTNMESMFDGCLILNQPFDKWNLSNVRLMAGIFNNCRQLDQDFSSWRFPNNSEIGFANSGISSANYDKMLNAWAAADEMPKKIKLVAGSLFYTQEGEVARTKLKTEKEWEFKGDGKRSETFAFEKYVNFVYVGEEIELKLIVAPNLPNEETKFHHSTDDVEVSQINEHTMKVKGVKETKISWSNSMVVVNRTTDKSTNPHKVVTAVATVKVRERHKVREIVLPDLSVHVDQRLLANYYVMPGNAMNKEVTWSIEGNTEVAEVDTEGGVKGKKEGTCTLVATSSDGAQARATVTVTPKPVEIPKGVEDAVLENIAVYPNPFDASLYIAGNVNLMDVHYELLTLQGHKVAQGKLMGNETIVDTSSLESGLYLLQLTRGNGIKRVIKVLKN